MFMDKCSGGCGRKRSDGYVLVSGFCLWCKPEEWQKRRRELREQARKLFGDVAREGA